MSSEECKPKEGISLKIVTSELKTLDREMVDKFRELGFALKTVTLVPDIENLAAPGDIICFNGPC